MDKLKNDKKCSMESTPHIAPLGESLYLPPAIDIHHTPANISVDPDPGDPIKEGFDPKSGYKGPNDANTIIP